MFDVGFSELIVVALVALVVIGPERLPKVARTAGILLGRLQRYVNDVKADINREMQLDELKRLQQQVAESARDLEASVNKEITSVEEALQQTSMTDEKPAYAAEPAVAPEQAVAADVVDSSSWEPQPVAADAPADVPAETDAAQQMELDLGRQAAARKVG
jgi:sec-independent protein translocase protein TatB